MMYSSMAWVSLTQRVHMVAREHITGSELNGAVIRSMGGKAIRSSGGFIFQTRRSVGNGCASRRL